MDFNGLTKMIFMDVRWMKRAFHWPPPIRNLGGDFLRQNSESVGIVPPFGSIYLKIEIVETINATVTGPFLSGYQCFCHARFTVCTTKNEKWKRDNLRGVNWTGVYY